MSGTSCFQGGWGKIPIVTLDFAWSTQRIPIKNIQLILLNYAKEPTTTYQISLLGYESGISGSNVIGETGFQEYACF